MLCLFHFRTGGGEGIRGEGEGSPKLTQPGSGARGGREGASHHLHHQAPGTRHTRLTRLTSPILSTSPAIFSSSFYSSPSPRPPPLGPPGPSWSFNHRLASTTSCGASTSWNCSQTPPSPPTPSPWGIPSSPTPPTPTKTRWLVGRAHPPPGRGGD